MSDKWDLMIDDLISGAQRWEMDDENEPECAEARSALRAAIDEVVKTKDNWHDASENAENRVEQLEAQLKAANEDAERLAKPRVDEDGKLRCNHCNGWGYGWEGEGHVDHNPDCPITLHRACVAKVEG
jgi:hypothetical protein